MEVRIIGKSHVTQVKKQEERNGMEYRKVGWKEGRKIEGDGKKRSRAKLYVPSGETRKGVPPKK